MTGKLFIGGLSWNTDDGLLKETFEKFGSVSDVKVVVDHQTGRSRGFGFVSYENIDDAATAIAQADGSLLDGRTITVKRAEPKRNDRFNRPNRDRHFN